MNPSLNSMKKTVLDSADKINNWPSGRMLTFLISGGILHIDACQQYQASAGARTILQHQHETHEDSCLPRDSWVFRSALHSTRGQGLPYTQQLNISIRGAPRGDRPRSNKTKCARTAYDNNAVVLSCMSWCRGKRAPITLSPVPQCYRARLPVRPSAT